MSTLVKKPPTAPIEAMQFGWLDRSFRRLLSDMPFAITGLAPAADVYETSDEYVVELEVPGYDEADLTLEIADRTLTIKGIRDETKADEEKSYRLHERLEMAFERTFTLPPEAVGEDVTAVFENGVLKIHAPKLASVPPRKVEISRV
jgi:HSP20 family protein